MYPPLNRSSFGYSRFPEDGSLHPVFIDVLEEAKPLNDPKVPVCPEKDKGTFKESLHTFN